MNIDRTHLNWLVGTLLIAILATTAHLVMPAGSIAGRRVDFLLGVCGTGMMLFTGLLSLRKKLKNTKWPILGLQTWLKGHVWLGLLSILMVLLHAGFRRGGVLTTVLSLFSRQSCFPVSPVCFFSISWCLPTRHRSRGRPPLQPTPSRSGVGPTIRLHVPLTATLLVLVAAHVLASLYY